MNFKTYKLFNINTADLSHYDETRKIVTVAFKEEKVGKTLVFLYGGRILNRDNYKVWKLYGNKASNLIKDVNWLGKF